MRISRGTVKNTPTFTPALDALQVLELFNVIAVDEAGTQGS